MRNNLRIGDLFVNYDPEKNTIDEKSWLVILLIKNFIFFVILPIVFNRVYETLHGRRINGRFLYKAVAQEGVNFGISQNFVK